MKAVERTLNEGDRACDEQAKLSAGLVQIKPSAQEWSDIQYSYASEYYLSLADGSYNNNNKNNLYWVVPVESNEVSDLVFRAEEDCWSNKHSSWDAAKYHYHTGRRVWQFIRELENRTYKPWKSYCFIVMYPKPREIFAAHYQDRIAHHIVAPYLTAIAEAVHNKNGNVSFGNRKKMSSLHACKRVQEMMRKHPNGYIATFDLEGYFMSIDRSVAWDVFCEYERQYRPSSINAEYREFVMWLAEILIKHDPSLNCERRSPQRLWDEHIKPSKTLFGNCGNGLPIGNYYSQIIANLIPERMCEAMLRYDITEFVDDFAVVVDNAEDVKGAQDVMDNMLSMLKLNRNKKKTYIQPVRHGVLWCGHFIYADRMYTSNRTIHNCERKVKAALVNPTLRKASRLQQTINSYFGMMRHSNEYKTQKRIACSIEASEYSEWLMFEEYESHIVCRMRKEYRPVALSAVELLELENYYKHKEYDSNTD